MSTLPGPESWRDAGLDQVDPGGDVEIAPAADQPTLPSGADAAADANPADVAEQAQPAGPDDDATGPLGGTDVLANPADVAEQAQSVPPDERDDYP